MVIIAFHPSINSTLTRLSQRLSTPPPDRIFQCYIQFRSNGGLFVNLLPYCPRDLQLGGIDGAGAAGHKLGGLVGRFILTQLCLLPQHNSCLSQYSNLRILVSSGRDPRSRDESNGQRPPAPAGWFGAISGWGEAAGRGGSQK